MKRFIEGFAVLAACAFATDASAQSAWFEMRPDQSGFDGSAVCALGTASIGHSFCFSTACRADEPLRFWIATEGASLPPQFRAEIMVDGSLWGALAFGPVGDNDPGPVAAYDPDRHGPMIAALKSGRGAQLVLPGIGVQDLTLRGSTKALDHALTVCPPPPPEPVSDPRAVIEQETTETCAQFGGTMTFGDGFQTDQDLDGDGTPELVIHLDAARCDAATSLFCGSAGCPKVIFQALPEGGYQEVFNEHAYSIEAKTQTIIYMDFHGSACGQAGAAPCRKAFVLEDGDLKPLDPSQAVPSGFAICQNGPLRGPGKTC